MHPLLPGLIDAHAHLLPGSVEHALTFGVTTVVDMWSAPELAVGIRRRAKADPSIADVVTATYGATATGGHPSLMYAPMPTIDRPSEATAFVDARLADGAAFLKIIADLDDAGPFPQATVDDETTAALITAAHLRGLRVAAHATTVGAYRRAASLGADELEHVPIAEPLPADLAATLAAQGVVATPTLACLEHPLGIAGGAALAADADLGPQLGRRWSELLREEPWARWGAGPAPEWADVQANVSNLAEAGVTLLAGTDAPNPGTAHGVSLHRELELLVGCGLSPTAALTAATSDPARVHGLDDRGLVAVGRRADLVLVRGDPTVDIAATRRLVEVWRGGVEVDRSSYVGSAAEDAEVCELLAGRAKVTEGLGALGIDLGDWSPPA